MLSIKINGAPVEFRPRRLYTQRTTGYRRDGRRVWIFARAGRWWLHVELLNRAVGIRF